MDALFLKNIQSLNLELSGLNKIMVDIEKTIDENISTFGELQNHIETQRQSIKEENTLKNYPSGAQGSVFFHNVMSNKFDLFDINHLNKITRFFTYIEKLEDQYASLYSKATTIYYKNPYDQSISDLYSVYAKILDSYHLLFLLIVEVDGDQLLYHQVFNKLEDSGIFLTLNEKKLLDTMAEISGKLTEIIKSVKTQISVSNETNRLLLQSIDALNGLTSDINYLSSDISSIGYNVSDMQSEIWGLSQVKTS